MKRRLKRIAFLVATMGIALIPTGIVSAETSEVDAEHSVAVMQDVNATAEVTGLESENDFLYNVLPDGTLRIIGYAGSSTVLDIPEKIDGKTVSTIGKEAFYNRKTTVIKVILPDTVTTIEQDAFCRCESMKSIKLSKSLVTIGDGAFYNCVKLKELEFPDSLVKVGREAFACSGLTSITFPNSELEVGIYAFEGCQVTSLVIPGNIKFASPCFRNCLQLESVEFINAKSVPDEMFLGCTKLKSVKLGDTITKIGKSAFSGCGGITEIMFSDALTTIGDYAFKDCTGLTRIVLPDALTTIDIEHGAFEYCTGLTRIVFPDALTTITIGTWAFWNCDGITEIVITDAVTTIGDYAFSFCDKLSSVEMTDSVTSVGRFAFKDCIQLTSIRLSDSISNISDGIFQSCTNLRTLNIPKRLTSIGVGAFDHCTNLEEVVLPHTVTVIGGAAFRGCRNLKVIRIPNYDRIGSSVLEGCRMLTIYTEEGSNVDKNFGSRHQIRYTTHTEKIIPADVEKKSNGRLKVYCEPFGDLVKSKTIYYPKFIGVSQKEFVYNGTKQIPDITVKDVKGKVIDPSNYTIVFDENSTKIGKYSCKVVFNGERYTGSLSTSYTIVPKATQIHSLESTTDGVLITWGANSQATGYRIYRSVDGVNYRRICVIEGKKNISYIDTAANRNGRKYYYKICAYNTNSNGTFKSEYSEVKEIVYRMP